MCIWPHLKISEIYMKRKVLEERLAMVFVNEACWWIKKVLVWGQKRVRLWGGVTLGEILCTWEPIIGEREITYFWGGFFAYAFFLRKQKWIFFLRKSKGCVFLTTCTKRLFQVTLLFLLCLQNKQTSNKIFVPKNIETHVMDYALIFHLLLLIKSISTRKAMGSSESSKKLRTGVSRFSWSSFWSIWISIHSFQERGRNNAELTAILSIL